MARFISTKDVKVELDQKVLNLQNCEKITVNHPATQGKAGVTHLDLEEETAQLQIKLKGEYSTVGSRLPGLPWLEKTPIENFFVPLAIQKKDRSGKVVRRKDIDYSDIFKQLKGMMPPKRILLSGEPGFGKSVLVTKITQDWATEEEGNFSNFIHVFLLNLRKFRDGQTIVSSILVMCQKKLNKTLRKYDPETVFCLVFRNSLIILDGFDEVGRKAQSAVCDFLSFQSVSFEGTVLVTSRPGYDNSFFELFDRHVHLCALSHKTRDSIVNVTFGTDEARAREVIKFLSKHESGFLPELSPLLLYACCFVFQNSDEVKVTETTDFVFEVCKMLLKRTMQVQTRRLSDQSCKDILSSLGMYFYDMLRVKYLEFKGSDLQKALGKNHKVVLEMGILQSLDENKYTVIHKLFMDTLAVHYLNDSIKNHSSIEGKMEFIRAFLGDRDSVRINIILHLKFPGLMLRGEFPDVIYLVGDMKSIAKGTFVLHSKFRNVFSEESKIILETLSSKVQNLLKNPANTEPVYVKYCRESVVMKYKTLEVSSFGRVIISPALWQERKALRSNNELQNDHLLLDVIYNKNLPQRTKDKEFTILIREESLKGVILVRENSKEESRRLSRCNSDCFKDFTCCSFYRRRYQSEKSSLYPDA